ncbi:MAG: hypothetical protein L6V93_18455 [Clostridiales bacterium]|nr:MAG: hypothetical protein L6V93_18455 [Clostridiales bacterium]
MVWNNSRLYKSDNFFPITLKFRSPTRRKRFFGTEGANFDIVKGDNGYIAKWGAYDGAPSYFESVLKFYNKVYIF